MIAGKASRKGSNVFSNLQPVLDPFLEAFPQCDICGYTLPRPSDRHRPPGVGASAFGNFFVVTTANAHTGVDPL